MAHERYVLITVECPRCKTKQKIHVAITLGGTEYGPQSIRCLNCDNRVSVMVSDRIIDGPFPA
jgi:phage FluMu protein Com